jgi:hypothetical protein
MIPEGAVLKTTFAGFLRSYSRTISHLIGRSGSAHPRLRCIELECSVMRTQTPHWLLS